MRARNVEGEREREKTRKIDRRVNSPPRGFSSVLRTRERGCANRACVRVYVHTHPHAKTTRRVFTVYDYNLICTSWQMATESDVEILKQSAASGRYGARC